MKYICYLQGVSCYFEEEATSLTTVFEKNINGTVSTTNYLNRDKLGTTV
jgi:hypothetical protein